MACAIFLARHEAAPVLMQCPLSRKTPYGRHVTLKAAALLFVEMPGIEPGSTWDTSIIFMLSSFGIATRA